jgi:hypothetical protein
MEHNLLGPTAQYRSGASGQKWVAMISIWQIMLVLQPKYGPWQVWRNSKMHVMSRRGIAEGQDLAPPSEAGLGGRYCLDGCDDGKSIESIFSTLQDSVVGSGPYQT